VRLLYRIAAETTPEIKQAVIELMRQHPNFSDFQITQIISDRFAILTTCTTVHLNPIERFWGAANKDLSGAKFQHEKMQFKSLRGYGLNLNSLPLILSWVPSPIELQR
jgi:hypothetical protein